ncbi:MAG: DUF1553 domain-containing protein [Bryobacterales bacterium]|nr:DUF1553 domain-containing protein [Bryobacterales bacterium]
MRPATLVLPLFAAVLVAFEGAAPSEKYTPVERRHWAFQPRAAVQPPALRPAAAHPIDAFIRAKLAEKSLRPAPPADKATLVRRVYFDLTGLPPTPAEVQAFVQNRSPKAYEDLLDRLLASPAYAERWAQHWLDVVRFAETDGFEYDTHRPDAWRFRDYVIKAFAEDRPYDQFLREQLAGDEIDNTNPELRTAAGLQRLGALRKNAGNQEVASSRNEVMTEMTNIVGAAFLGVTLGCARCHDHKFDPIRHTDYYRMQAFFAPVWEKDLDLGSPEQRTAWEAAKKEHAGKLKELRGQMKQITDGEEKGRMLARIRDLEETPPEPPPAVFSVGNDFSKAMPVHVLARGDYQNKGARVGMRPLGVLLPDGAPEWSPDLKNPRTRLAEWITAPENPLTARVLANRLWAYHFGRGIVATPNDFGRMGGRPSHPQLLDYLANRLVEGGWRIKPMHKLIMMSETYRQDSTNAALAAAGTETDPENALLWRYSRRRLDAEQIRDSMLAVAGRLNARSGGPSVIVPVDSELVGLLYKPAQWAVTKDVREHDRRSVYLLHKRNLRLPMMEVFDAPDMQTSCARRESSTHAPQALELMNGPFANDLARSFAARLDQGARTPAAQVDLAYQLAAGRPATPKERALGTKFLATHPLSEFALAILNLNAFLYVN